MTPLVSEGREGYVRVRLLDELAGREIIGVTDDFVTIG